MTIEFMSVDPAADIQRVRAFDESHGLFVTAYLSVTKALGKKCARCWKISEDVDTHEWSDVCLRCNNVLQEMFNAGKITLHS